MQADEIARILLQNRLDLTAYLRVIVRDAARAEDVFQETVVKALRCEEEFASEENLLRWARKVGRNRCIDHIRREGREAKVLDERALDILEAQAGQSEPASAAERLRALEICLDKLTPRAREVLQLRFHEGLSGDEVASRCNTSLQAIYKMLGRSYSQLRACMTRRLATEDRNG